MRYLVLLPTVLTVTFCLSLPTAAAENQDQTVSLFNGKDFSGWTAYLRNPRAQLADVWSVQDGLLICKGRPIGYIRTKADYENYVLSLQWRWKPGSKGGNSGVLLHMIGKDKVWPKSIESQLKHGNAGDFYVIGGTTLKVENAAVRQKGRQARNVTDGSENKLGQWNTMKITCNSDEIIVEVNGELVNHATQCSATKGHICLQSEGAEIHFRNIKLTPINRK